MSAHDLFAWRDEADAADAAAAAETAREEAKRRVLYAPHGQVVARRAALTAATTDALRAELALSRARGGGGDAR